MHHVILAKSLTVLATYPIHRCVVHQYVHGGNFAKVFAKMVKEKKLYKGIGFQCAYCSITRAIDTELYNHMTEHNEVLICNGSAISKVLLYPLQIMERSKQTARKLKMFAGIQYQYLVYTTGYYAFYKFYNFLEKRVKTKNKNVNASIVGGLSGAATEITTNPLKVIKTHLQEGRRIKTFKTYTNGLLPKIFLNGIQSSVFNLLWKLW
jgi:hypothetical protein